MLLENIPLGRTLEIYVNRDEYRYRLISKVEDTGKKRVCVTAIASNGRFFQFLPTDKVSIVCRDGDFIWEWDNVEAGLAKLDDDPVHYFQIVDKGRSFNRRNTYRIPYMEEIQVGFYLLPGKKKRLAELPAPPKKVTLEELKEWEMKMPKPIQVCGMIKDISENGIGIYCDEEFQIGDGIFFRIPTTYGKLETTAEIIRITKLRSGKEKYAYYYGCVLTKTDCRLISFIYACQREMLRRKKEKEDS